MHIDLLRSKPFDSASKPETAAHASQRAKAVPQQRPGATAGGEARVVVRFAVMDVEAQPLALAKTVIQQSRYVAAVVVLEQFRVGPLHPAFCQQCLGRLQRSAQAFEQEKRFWILLANTSLNVLPDRQRHLVAGVAAKAVHATPAPRQERLCQLIPQLDELWIQFHQVAPGHAPRAGTDELSVGVVQKPGWMLLEKRRTPARMVDNHVQHHSRAPAMRLARQFA